MSKQKIRDRSKCEVPWKLFFENFLDAARNAKNAEACLEKRMEVYGYCPCGYFHVAKAKRRNRPTSARSPEKKRRNRQSYRRNKVLRPQIETWESEGGAIL